MNERLNALFALFRNLAPTIERGVAPIAGGQIVNSARFQIEAKAKNIFRMTAPYHERITQILHELVAS